jgi:hypothetical protein
MVGHRRCQRCSITSEGASCNGVPQEDYSQRQTPTFQIFSKQSNICDFEESLHRFFLQQIYEVLQHLLLDHSSISFITSDSLHGQ